MGSFGGESRARGAVGAVRLKLEPLYCDAGRQYSPSESESEARQLCSVRVGWAARRGVGERAPAHRVGAGPSC